jgi:acetyl esterase/lipase
VYFRSKFLCMTRYLLIPILLLLATGMLYAQGRLLDYEHVATIPVSRMDSLLEQTGTPKRLVPVRYDVDVYSVRYTTAWHDGSVIRASGFYMVPKGAKEKVARLCYNHGSRSQKFWDFKFSAEEAICCYFATDGYAVVMPDYVGLREGERNHLYHHSETEALANVDLLRAVREIDQDLGVSVNDQLFITGYSQGGHAALATHEYMQQHLADEFQVTASAPMSGAYDLRHTQATVMYDTYATPSYLPFLLYSMQSVYQLLPDSSAFFISPYDTLLPELFQGDLRLGEINKYLPDTPAAIVRPEVIKALQNDPDNIFWKAMVDNSPMHWAPEAPVMLCYCNGDEQVRWENSRVAKKTMRSEGAKNVRTLRAGGKKFGHGPCALFSNIYAKMWFDSFRKGSRKGRRGSLWNRFLLRMGRMKYKPQKR